MTSCEWRIDIFGTGNRNHDDIKRGTTTDNSATTDGLTVDGHYMLSVRAINEVGAGEWPVGINPVLGPSTEAIVLERLTSITVEEGSTFNYTIRLATTHQAVSDSHVNATKFLERQLPAAIHSSRKPALAALGHPPSPCL